MQLAASAQRQPVRRKAKLLWSGGAILFVAYAQFMLRRCTDVDGTLGPWLIALALAATFVVVRRKLRFEAWTMGILTLATALYLAYASYTSLIKRNYDPREEFYYANAIAEHLSLPSARACSICVHPPLYFALGAVAIRVARASHLMSPVCSVQMLTLGLSLLFVTFAALTIRLVVESRLARSAGLALVAFWPTSVINSIRIHDDALISAMGAGVLYFSLRWYRDDRRTSLAGAVACAAAAVLTKANGYGWALLPLMLIAWRLVRTRFQPRQLKSLAVSAVAILLATYVAVESRNSGRPAGTCHRTVGNICDVRSEHFAGNRWTNYLKFDLDFFLREPFLIGDPSDKSKDRVPNHLLKTSLLNAIPLGPEFEDPTSAALSTTFSVLLCALGTYLALGLVHVRAQHVRTYAPLMIGVLLALGQVIALRIFVPLSTHADFRYAFPILISAAVFYSKLVEYYQRRSRVAAFSGVVIAGGFVLASLAFFRPTPYRTRQAGFPVLQTVTTTLSQTSEVHPNGTRIADVLRFGPRQVLEVQLPQPTDVSRLDMSLDAGDEYEVIIASSTFSLALNVGPSLSVQGLARYVKVLRYPVRNARTIRIRPQLSDGDYALGHLIVN